MTKIMKERTQWMISGLIVLVLASTITLLGLFAPIALGYIAIVILIAAALLGVTVVVKMFLSKLFN